MGCSVGGDNWFLGTTPLKKVPYNTKLQQWLRDWLTASERGERPGNDRKSALQNVQIAPTG
jgi:hypothetical protein